MVKQSISVAFVTGGITVIGASFYSQKPPELYYGIAIGLFLCLVIPFGIFVWNYRHCPRFGIITIPTRGFEMSIQKYPPNIVLKEIEMDETILGYNNLKFDVPFMLKRLEILGKSDPGCGKSTTGNGLTSINFLEMTNRSLRLWPQRAGIKRAIPELEGRVA